MPANVGENVPKIANIAKLFYNMNIDNISITFILVYMYKWTALSYIEMTSSSDLAKKSDFGTFMGRRNKHGIPTSIVL